MSPDGLLLRDLDRLLLRELLRVSKDKSGREASPERQHKDHGRDCERHPGWELHPDPYREVGSASRYAKKARKDFDRLIADLRNDTFGAGALALWESSRGSRRVSEWALLLDLLDDREKLVWVHTHNRLYDPRNPRDRRTLLDEAVDAEYEVGKTSERLRGDARKAAEDGRPWGTVRFGYRRLYDERTGRLINDEPDPVESPLIEELFERFYEGASLYSIERDWEARGVTRRGGGFFSKEHLRSLLMNPSYAGFRAHDPGHQTGYRLYLSSSDRRLFPAMWEGIVDSKLFFDVQRILADPGRKTMKSGKAKHLLSIIARCDPCGGPLAAKTTAGVDKYRCLKRGCVAVRKAELEAFAESTLLEYLARPELHQQLRQVDEQASEQLGDVERKLTEARGELAALKRKVSSGELTVDWVADVAPGIKERIARLEEQQNALAVAPALLGFLRPGDDVRARWEDSELSAKRAVLRIVFSPEWAGELRVVRSPTRGRWSITPVSERVVFRRADPS